MRSVRCPNSDLMFRPVVSVLLHARYLTLQPMACVINRRSV
jgi:hypothetical protein